MSTPPPFRTIIEPFRIKMVEPLRMTTRDERRALLAAAGWNPFLLAAEDVLIDLLTDSGTSAMSQEQWAGMMRGDESYAGARSWFRFRDSVRAVTGFEHVIPAHQGRAAERILFSTLLQPGQTVICNTLFDTTRANVESAGAKPLDLPCAELANMQSDAPFKGNMDLSALETALRQPNANIGLVMMTLTNNSGGGQPASLANLKSVAQLARNANVPFWIDACRFAENSWLVREREASQQGRSPRSIARECFDLADGCTFSAKKDAFANIGGFLAMRDGELARKGRNLLVLTEGFPTYGGLAGRDLEAIAQGLDEVLHEDYLRYRIASTAWVHRALVDQGVPVMRPAGGHAVYIDARAFLPHVPAEELPGVALTSALYEDAGIRGIEIGTVMFGHTDPHTGREVPHVRDLVRLAIPRRVYTQSHMEYAVEGIARSFARRAEIGGFAFAQQEPVLRHFTARFRPL